MDCALDCAGMAVVLVAFVYFARDPFTVSYTVHTVWLGHLNPSTSEHLRYDACNDPERIASA